MRWRHVTYSPIKNKQWRDFSWEREWRLNKSELILDSRRMLAVVPSDCWNKRLLASFKQWSEYMEEIDVLVLGGTGALTPPVPPLLVRTLTNR